ncbi:60S ribosomal protein L29 [Camelus dromedarius]|uniref:60S ribosomal protein L29 n=2 Tax=Camelus TaxID=9836 RepID=S9WC19_CAMFR|nr:60S ribosomal protein L29 [Camelus ferus]EPY75762.1 60S ribosomal protein L29 (Cell surface heparin binding protein HIP)-like protein [Camelus ferus]KAB1272925.1 60S ribosomal protein L29 [Camelus dromedarius]
MCFAKKHKRGLKKMQADNAKATSARAEAVKALGKPKEVKPKIPQGSSHELSRPACIAHPMHGLLTPSLGNVLVPASPRGSGSAGQRPSPRLNQGRSCSYDSGSKRRPGLHKGSRVEAFIY